MPADHNSTRGLFEELTDPTIATPVKDPGGRLGPGGWVPPTSAPTPASDWRKAARTGLTVTTPTGKTCIIQRTMDLAVRLRDGSIPNPLAGIVATMIDEGRTQMTPEESSPEVQAQMLQMMDETICLMMIEPRCEMRPDDAPFDWEPSIGAISTEEIDIEDKVYLYNVAQGGTTDLVSFRQIALSVVEAVPGKQAVEQPPVGTDGAVS